MIKINFSLIDEQKDRSLLETNNGEHALDQGEFNTFLYCSLTITLCYLLLWTVTQFLYYELLGNNGNEDLYVLSVQKDP